MKKRSKFSASRPHCGGERKREKEMEKERGAGRGWHEYDGVRDVEKKWTPNKQRGKKEKDN